MGTQAAAWIIMDGVSGVAACGIPGEFGDVRFRTALIKHSLVAYVRFNSFSFPPMDNSESIGKYV
jgi:hypothetical protein